jgi:hypothetical protein
MSNSRSEPKDSRTTPATMTLSDLSGSTSEALGGGLAPLFEWRGLKQPPGGLEQSKFDVFLLHKFEPVLCVGSWTTSLLHNYHIYIYTIIYIICIYILHIWYMCIAAVLDQYSHVWCLLRTYADQDAFGLPAGRFCSWTTQFDHREGLLSNIHYQWSFILAGKIIYKWGLYTNLHHLVT